MNITILKLIFRQLIPALLIGFSCYIAVSLDQALIKPGSGQAIIQCHNESLNLAINPSSSQDLSQILTYQFLCHKPD